MTTVEDFIEEEQQQVLIPDYLYICLYDYCKIPNKKNIEHFFQSILTVSNIEYDINKNGIVSGIYVYFQYINPENFGSMMKKIKYSGSFVMITTFVNSIKHDFCGYNIIASDKYKKNFSKKPPELMPPKLVRQSGIFNYQIKNTSEEDIYNFIAFNNMSKSLDVLNNITELIKDKECAKETLNKRLGAQFPYGPDFVSF